MFTAQAARNAAEFHSPPASASVYTLPRGSARATFPECRALACVRVSSPGSHLAARAATPLLHPCARQSVPPGRALPGSFLPSLPPTPLRSFLAAYCSAGGRAELEQDGVAASPRVSTGTAPSFALPLGPAAAALEWCSGSAASYPALVLSLP